MLHNKLGDKVEYPYSFLKSEGRLLMPSPSNEDNKRINVLINNVGLQLPILKIFFFARVSCMSLIVLAGNVSLRVYCYLCMAQMAVSLVLATEYLRD
ncbi:MAG: hypothetical protein RIS47_672 [Bacteroidota bacterium]|jgi:hypothetical protein